MPAHEKLSDLQFSYDTVDTGAPKPMHRLNAMHPEHGRVGQMTWTPKGIDYILATRPREGVGTALWNEGHRLASENAKIPAPKHSPDRTQAGDAWARSVGGRLPRRKK